MQKINTYKLPPSGEARELLRQKGQFWTPDWVAEAMSEYVLADRGGMLFDPAVGAGAFFRAAKTVAKEKGLYVTLAGMDIDPSALKQALEYGLSKADIARVTIGDFVFQPPQAKLFAIVANPPYIRHHRISAANKEQLKRLSLQTIGTILDGRAGLHIYFLIRALSLLEDNGRLAFIMPADTCEGKFASDLWHWISANYALEAVITFAPEASPFPDVDTNPIIFFIRKASPPKKFLWVKCYEARTESFKTWVRSGFTIVPNKALTVVERDLSEGLNTGLSRPPMSAKMSKYVLGDFVQVVRGVATGANAFFFMTDEQAKQIGIPENYFVRAIGRTRDVPTEEITQETLDSLRAKGRPTLLLALNDEPFENYPESLKKYLKSGETLGLPQRPLISQRKPWYKMESRPTPPFLFAYLGRRNSRFIRNSAKIIPLTSFLCIYPKSNDREYVERVWKILNNPETIANLSMIGKSYGDGAIKVEPRSLEKLPIPDTVIEQSGLPLQMRLFEDTIPCQTTTYASRRQSKTDPHSD
ncbi:MAG: SAM-dependent methyltransferase [Chloroflexi bacterium]|nr:SAM-dependent methyltransferase [Chloroflexota bacterium]MCI0728863.1 SAM-dependent methyltransferase [Chloroflexota bacterium]